MQRNVVFILFLLVTAGWVRAANPAMPVIPATIFNVTNYGAIGDGVKDNTTNIQNTINTASAAGGGVVEIPAGTFLSGPITLLSSINLQVDTNGLLQMLPLGTYPGGTTNAQTFIYCDQVTDLAISGRGTIDGQGAAWWVYNATNSSIVRPMLLNLYNCNRLFIHDITFQNPPFHHCGVRDYSGNVTISNLTVNTVSPSPNTDGVDFTATNSIIENCYISDGDDNLAIGSTGPVNDLLVTNCFFGTGHGVSILGPTAALSNMTVINCAFNGTGNGIRWKCSMGSSAPVQNVNYFNLTMTNVGLPIVIYSYYNVTGTPDNITPAEVLAASNTAPVTATTPVWSDITISNLNIASGSGSAIGGVIWGPTEMPISNLTLIRITNTAPKTFDIYNAQDVKIIDSQFNFSSGNTFTLCNGGVTISNTVPASRAVTIGGAASTNSLALYNAPAFLNSSNLFAANPITLGGSVLTNTGNLTLTGSTVQNFSLGTNAATISVVGSLAPGGTNNIYAGGGFTNGTYKLMTYTGTLSGSLPVLGSSPAGYNCAFNTNTAGQVNLVATYAGVFSTPTTNTVQSSVNPSTYGTAVMFTATVSPAPTNGETVTFKDGATTLGTGTLAGGQAIFNTTADQLVAGSHLITAVYAGDGNYGDSTSAGLTQTVNPPAGTVFSDTFGTSTVNSGSPSAPTATVTSYEVISSKPWLPTPGISAGHLQFGIGATASGDIEAQALFTRAPVPLATPGDTLSLMVTFTNTSGLLAESSALGIGLYHSGQNYPVAGGLNGTATTGSSGNASGNAQTWAGYVGQIAFTGGSSQILTRPPQTGAFNNNQDVVTTGSGSSSYGNPAAATVGAASTVPSVTLAAGNPYTEVLTITLTATNALAITNILYSGMNTNGALLSQFGGVATGGAFLTNTFDALAVGWRATTNISTTEIDVNQITINAMVAPLVSLIPTNLLAQVVGDQLQLSWPLDHLGWRLEIQTNNLNSGLGTNWATVGNSTNISSTNIVINPANGSVFLRLVYP